jgi:Protein of unknown function (DUF3176)
MFSTGERLLGSSPLTSAELNAMISLLATLAKSGLMFAVAAAISQDKWLWMLKKPRALKVIDTFEYASRGPFGSVTILLMRYGQ